MDAARGASFAADQDEGPQRGSGRPIPPLVSKIQVATTNAGARAEGGLTPDFLALSTSTARTFDYRAGDVGFVPRTLGQSKTSARQTADCSTSSTIAERLRDSRRLSL